MCAMQLTIILIPNYHAPTMYVCICHAVTDKDIHKVVDRGASSLFDVQNELPVGSCCGRCADTAKSVVDEYLSSRRRDDCALRLVAEPAI
jgi:bacterioferritin-associated ferredoxin